MTEERQPYGEAEKGSDEKKAQPNTEGAASMLKAVVPVVVGALIGVASMSISASLQARTTAKQRVTELRIQTIKDFSTACHRLALVMQRMDSAFTLFRARSLTNENVQRLVGEFKELMREADDAQLALQAEGDFANAIFGTSIPDFPPVERRALDLDLSVTAAMEQFGAMLREGPVLATKRCQSLTDQLTAKITD